MIRIERGQEVKPGIWEYTVPAMPIAGHSSQPLLDACRQIQAILGDPCREHAGIWREGKDQPDMTCAVDVGARYRVAEDTKSRPRFRKFESFDPSVFRTSAPQDALDEQHPSTRTGPRSINEQTPPAAS
jgi:hypothetical protein